MLPGPKVKYWSASTAHTALSGLRGSRGEIVWPGSCAHSLIALFALAELMFALSLERGSDSLTSLSLPSLQLTNLPVY